VKRTTRHQVLRAAPMILVVAALSAQLLSQSLGNRAQTAESPITLASPHYQADFTPVISNGYHAVSWGKGYLVSFGMSEIKEPITLYDKAGNWLFATFPSFEGASHIYGQDARPTKSGTVILAASASNGDGAVADMIAEVGKEGILRIIRTTHFYVEKICTTDDGSVWAYGHELTEDRRQEPRTHFPLLREYSFEKGQLRATLDRATVHPPAGVPLSGSRNDVYLLCGSGKVVLANGATNELMQYDLASNTLSRWPIAPFQDGSYMTGAALTESGDVYVSVLRASPKTESAILRLHVTSAGIAEWTSLGTIPSPGSYFILLGNDGNDLVYSRGRRTPTVFWSRAPQTEVTK
jgi:hypothetical protein